MFIHISKILFFDLSLFYIYLLTNFTLFYITYFYYFLDKEVRMSIYILFSYSIPL